jgi:nucleotide-binding universal stress UspA family protein
MPEIGLQQILAPVDFSDSSADSLAYACALAEKFSAQLHVLHVLEDPADYARKAESWAVLPQLRDRLEREAQGKLEALGPTDAILEVRWGAPFLEILGYAKEHLVDMIVMGSHGHGAVKHLLLGSVAEKVVRKAGCPVLTVRDPKHRYVSP